MNKKDENKGITLIALVVTIIVLLILAGASIAMLAGDNSILSRAVDAKENTENSQITERAKLAYQSALAEGKGQITEELFEAELDKEFGENGYELTTDDTTEEWVVKVNSVDRLRVNKPTATTGAYGYNSTGNYFIGQKSIGKNDEGVEDNTQTSNWDSSENGYKFTSGHFVRITNYSGWLWDEATNEFQEKTGADVYLCWDADYGNNISSEQDLIDYAINNSTTTYWDIFDASSGAWLYDGHYGYGEF